jgi:hypothetical protein
MRGCATALHFGSGPPRRPGRFAYDHLDPRNPLVDPKYPLAIVAYAVIEGSVIIGFQQDVFTANEDVYREDWSIYFDARDHIFGELQDRIRSDDMGAPLRGATA